jgi:hypothetical protein
MSMKRTEPKERRLLEYDRAMLRAAFVSLFWGAITEHKRRGKYTLQMLADKLGRNKSGVSRWFSSNPPNWGVDTISDIANALDLEIDIRATDRITGRVFTSSGILAAAQTSSIFQRIERVGADVPQTETELEPIRPVIVPHIPGIVYRSVTLQ